MPTCKALMYSFNVLVINNLDFSLILHYWVITATSISGYVICAWQEHVLNNCCRSGSDSSYNSWLVNHLTNIFCVSSFDISLKLCRIRVRRALLGPPWITANGLMMIAIWCFDIIQIIRTYHQYNHEIFTIITSLDNNRACYTPYLHCRLCLHIAQQHGNDTASGPSSASLSPVYQHGLTLIPTWISNYTLSKVWHEITW